jgi:hypothetical protein
MSRWFRFYDDAVNDPKVQRLPGEKFKTWVNLLCLASKNDGVLPSLADIAFSLRLSDEKVSAMLKDFCLQGLLDPDAGGYAPHNWGGRQFKSDVSNERVKQHRQRKRNVTHAVTVTTPETEQKQTTEQSRADARSDLEARTGNFRQAVVQAFASANSPNFPETSRCGLWLSQGYQEDICLAVITEIVRKKPSVTTLNYFDNAIKEAHASKAPPRQAVVMKPEEVNWDSVLSDFKKFNRWSRWAGPDLESPACKAPAEMLAKYGLTKAEPVEVPQLRVIQ